MMRNRFAFFALFPLVAFVAIVLPISWLLKISLLSIGMFPISLILLLAILPVFGAAAVACSGGLVVAWLLLYRPIKKWRLFCWLPLVFAPFSVYLGQFLANYLAQQEGGNPFLAIDVLTLQAHFLHPLLALLLSILIWTGKSVASEPTGIVKYALVKKILTGCAILSLWALSALVIVRTQDDIKQYMAQLRLDQIDVIDADGYKNPFVEAVCAGKLAHADQLIAQTNDAISADALRYAIRHCLKKRSGDLRTNIPPRFYIERVPVLLKAISIHEKLQALPAKNACSDLRNALLQPLYDDDVNELGLRMFLNLGLPINCQTKTDDGRTYPVWWNMVYGPGRLSFERLGRLEKVGISLHETDSQGQTFFSVHWHQFYNEIDDRALLQLLQRGFELPAARPGLQALNIEVMLRRFGYRDSDVNSPEHQQLLALVGEPSAQQLLDIRENKVNSFPERKTDDARSMALYAYIDQRISDLRQPSKAGESASLPNRVSPDAL